MSSAAYILTVLFGAICLVGGVAVARRTAHTHYPIFEYLFAGSGLCLIVLAALARTA